MRRPRRYGATFMPSQHYVARPQPRDFEQRMPGETYFISGTQKPIIMNVRREGIIQPEEAEKMGVPTQHFTFTMGGDDSGGIDMYGSRVKATMDGEDSPLPIAAKQVAQPERIYTSRDMEPVPVDGSDIVVMDRGEGAGQAPPGGQVNHFAPQEGEEMYTLPTDKSASEDKFPWVHCIVSFSLGAAATGIIWGIASSRKKKK